jgi:hypothetical protein
MYLSSSAPQVTKATLQPRVRVSSDDIPLVKRPKGKKDKALTAPVKSKSVSPESDREPVHKRLRTRKPGAVPPKYDAGVFGSDEEPLEKQSRRRRQAAASPSDDDNFSLGSGQDEGNSRGSEEDEGSPTGSEENVSPGSDGAQVKKQDKGKGKAKATVESKAQGNGKATVATAAPPPKIRKRNVATAAGSKSLVEMQNDFLKLRDNFRISSDPTLFYADRLRKNLADSSILRTLAPPNGMRQVLSRKTCCGSHHCLVAPTGQSPRHPGCKELEVSVRLRLMTALGEGRR